MVQWLVPRRREGRGGLWRWGLAPCIQRRFHSASCVECWWEEREQNHLSVPNCQHEYESLWFCVMTICMSWTCYLCVCVYLSIPLCVWAYFVEFSLVVTCAPIYHKICLNSSGMFVDRLSPKNVLPWNRIMQFLLCIRQWRVPSLAAGLLPCRQEVGKVLCSTYVVGGH